MTLLPGKMAITHLGPPRHIIIALLGSEIRFILCENREKTLELDKCALFVATRRILAEHGIGNTDEVPAVKSEPDREIDIFLPAEVWIESTQITEDRGSAHERAGGCATAIEDI